MKTGIPLNNFAFGQLDIDLKGRNDLPVYITGGEIVENFYCTTQGNLLFRQGFEFLEDNGNNAVYEFVFNQEQSYLLVFDETNIEFWSYSADGELVKVQSGGADLQVAHPYGNDRFDLKMAQKGDVLYIVHSGYAPRKLTRTGAAEFNFSTFSIIGSSFPQGKNPSAVAFYEGRLIYAIGTTIHGSKSNDYDNLTVGTGATDGFKFDIAELTSPILWLYPAKNSLISGSADGIAVINGGGVNLAITPTEVSAKLSSREGAYKADPIEKDGYIIYISQNQRNLYAFNYDILTEGFQSVLVNRASYDITRNKMERLEYKKDKYEFIYIRCGNDLLVFNFLPEENVRSLIKLKSQGEFQDICSVIKPDGDNDLFAVIKYNGDYYLTVLSALVEFSKFDDSYTGKDNYNADYLNFNRLINEEAKLCNFLDLSVIYNGYYDTTLTYDSDAGTIISTGTEFSSGDVGRIISYKTQTGKEVGQFKITSFISSSEVGVSVLVEPTSNSYTGWYLWASLLSNLDHLEGKTVSVIGDGSYIGDFEVSEGSIQLPSQYSIIIVGLPYTGIFKSFNYGFNVQGQTTQTSPKVLYKAFIRFIKSAGGNFGDSRYNLVPIQQFDPDGFYDVPPLLMDTDQEITYNNNNIRIDKRIYIVQDKPLPLQIAMIVPYFKHISNT